MSYSASIKTLEVELRALLLMAIDMHSQCGATSRVNSELLRRAARVRGLFQCIRSKTSGPAYSKMRQEVIGELMQQMLTKNLQRCAWLHVATMASDMQHFADYMGNTCAHRAREILEELMANSPCRNAP